MTFLRRQFLRLAIAAAALPNVSRDAKALDYPTQPVRVVVPFAPAGGTDILARLIGQRLSERLGQQFIIENRSGAGGNIGVETVVRAPPDGYTLLLVDNSPAINATLYGKLNFNFVREIAPVASIATQPLVLEANSSFPTTTVPKFMAYARANPGKINFASSGNGGSPHMAGELLKMMAGIDMVHVPYRGTGAALTDLLGGQVQIMIGSLLASIEYIKAGRLRALAVTSATRIDVLPEVPTLGEFVPGYEVSAWYGVGAPRNTPAEIIDRLNKEINAALADPKIKARIAELGATVFASSPVDFGKFVAEDTEKWAKVVKASGARAD